MGPPATSDRPGRARAIGAADENRIVAIQGATQVRSSLSGRLVKFDRVRGKRAEDVRAKQGGSWRGHPPCYLCEVAILCPCEETSHYTIKSRRPDFKHLPACLQRAIPARWCAGPSTTLSKIGARSRHPARPNVRVAGHRTRVAIRSRSRGCVTGNSVRRPSRRSENSDRSRVATASRAQQCGQ